MTVESQSGRENGRNVVSYALLADARLLWATFYFVKKNGEADLLGVNNVLKH